MPSICAHARIVLDIWSMKLVVWMLRLMCRSAVDLSGGILDSDLFFYDRYSDLADYHRQNGRTVTADRLAATAMAYFHAAPDDDEPPEAAAMAMPVPRPRVTTNAVSTLRLPKPRSDEPSGLAPSPAR